MVLDRNPAFIQWRDGDIQVGSDGRKHGGNRGRHSEGQLPQLLDPQLAEDAYFKAYRHISAAIELLQPMPVAFDPQDMTRGPSDPRNPYAENGNTEIAARVQLIAPASSSSNQATVRMADAIKQAHAELAKPAPVQSEPKLDCYEATATRADSVEAVVEPVGDGATAVSRSTEPVARVVGDHLFYAAMEASVEVVRAAPISPPSPPVAAAAEPKNERKRSWLNLMVGGF